MKIRYRFYLAAFIIISSHACSVDELPAPDSPNKAVYTEDPASLNDNSARWTYNLASASPQVYDRDVHTSSFPILETDFNCYLNIVVQTFNFQNQTDYLNVGTRLLSRPSSGSQYDLTNEDYKIELKRGDNYRTYYGGDPEVLGLMVQIGEIDYQNESIKGVIYVVLEEDFNGGRVVEHSISFDISVPPSGKQIIQ